MPVVTVNVSETVYALLAVLGHTEGFAPAPVAAVVATLIDHAQQGVYRPGSWERGWLIQAFGDEWLSQLEPGDPYGRDDERAGRIFQRPRRTR